MEGSQARGIADRESPLRLALLLAKRREHVISRYMLHIACSGRQFLG